MFGSCKVPLGVAAILVAMEGGSVTSRYHGS